MRLGPAFRRSPASIPNAGAVPDPSSAGSSGQLLVCRAVLLDIKVVSGENHHLPQRQGRGRQSPALSLTQKGPCGCVWPARRIFPHFRAGAVYGVVRRLDGDRKITDFGMKRERFPALFSSVLKPHRYCEAAFEVIGVHFIPHWWRRGESNPCPKARPQEPLRAQTILSIPLLSRGSSHCWAW